MGLDQARAPLFEALCDYAGRVKAPLHVPGHKLGRGAPEAWRQFLGERALSIDLTEVPGLDDLHAPEGVIAEAQALAAEAFGAKDSFFLVGGSTAGLQALILTACEPGDRIAVPRHAHRSILGGLILSGATPVWVRSRFHPELDLAVGLDPASLEATLPGVAAALFVHPTYYGMTGPLGEQIRLAHAHGAAALVDEAHGAHFAFYPGLPPSALSQGADGTVQSVHKTGGSLTQSSLCHRGHHSRLSASRLREMLRLVQSTSPSYLLMASLDLARRDLFTHGHLRWEQTLELAGRLHQQLGALPGVRVEPVDDPTKLVIDLRGRGYTGFAAAERLWSRGVAVETAGQGYLLAVLTPGDGPEQAAHLLQAVGDLPPGPGAPPAPPEPPWPEPVLSPREAYLGPKQTVPLDEAVGRIAAELIAPYPPGIAAVAPGERLTGDVVSYLRHVARGSHHLQGPADPHLQRIQVVRE